MPQVEREHGEEVRLSYRKTLLSLGKGLAQFAIGVGFGVLFVACVVSFDWKDYLWLICPVVGALSLVAGLVFVLFGFLTTAAELVSLGRRERFVLGKRALQCVAGGEVLEHVPYDNVEEVRLITREDETGVYRFLGLRLKDANRADTFFLSKDRRHPGLEAYDYVLHDSYTLPMKKFCKKVAARWRKQVGGAPGLEEDYEADGL